MALPDWISLETAKTQSEPSEKCCRQALETTISWLLSSSEKDRSSRGLSRSRKADEVQAEALVATRSRKQHRRDDEAGRPKDSGLGRLLSPLGGESGLRAI